MSEMQFTTQEVVTLVCLAASIEIDALGFKPDPLLVAIVAKAKIACDRIPTGTGFRIECPGIQIVG